MLINRGFIFSVFVVISTTLTVMSCNDDEDRTPNIIKQYVQTADSLLLTDKQYSALTFLMKQRPKFKNNDPHLSAYYEFLSVQYQLIDTLAASRYADSAIAIFNTPKNIDKYPEEYFKALMAKGDASIINKQYETALMYYDKAKKRLSTSNCDNGNLATKIAGIYYNQQNYGMAAKYWVESYKRLLSCPQTPSPQKLFYLTQAALNNIGVSYDKAGNYDSAGYYFKKDLAYINKMASLGIPDRANIDASSIVVYDNLGGLNLKQGNLAEAERYLAASVAIAIKDVDGMRITPFMKQAELYLKTGNLNKAAIAFAKSRQLLDMYGKDNPIPYVEWNRLFARYLLAKNQAGPAYQYQATYIRLKDSLEKTNAQLHRLDVARELHAIQRENLLAELKHKEKLEKLYITGATIVAILLLAISLFINKVLKESRRKHKNTRLHNEQLQQTLEELENANRNVVRIMRVMAHDLRNPLAGMIGLAQSASEGEMPEESKHMLRLLEDTGTHSLKMINELLSSGLADENETMSKQKLDIKELLRDSVELLQFRANEKKQQIIFESGGEPIVTNVNHEKIWRVFNNLIVNAIKFSYEGGMIFVSIKVTAVGNVLITIADNGMGIPDKDKDSIFEMFTPAKRLGTDGEQPFGLGLSISKRIVENHGGRLWFESSPGFGTTFYIELPFA
jgi:signal transduction histidine kinase